MGVPGQCRPFTPYNPPNLTLFKSFNSMADLSVQKYSGYPQDNIRLGNSRQDITLQAGLQYNYNSLNKEFPAEPRLQFSIKPNWKRDVVFKLAAGAYQQPPFTGNCGDTTAP